MVYICENCRFVFERTGEIFSCPDCAGPGIREASAPETAEFRKSRAEAGAGRPNGETAGEYSFGAQGISENNR